MMTIFSAIKKVMIAIFGIQFWMQYIINSLRNKLPVKLGIARFIPFSYYYNDITKCILQMHIDIFVFFSYMSFFNHKKIAYEK